MRVKGASHINWLAVICRYYTNTFPDSFQPCQKLACVELSYALHRPATANTTCDCSHWHARRRVRWGSSTSQVKARVIGLSSPKLIALSTTIARSRRPIFIYLTIKKQCARLQRLHHTITSRLGRKASTGLLERVHQAPLARIRWKGPYYLTVQRLTRDRQ